MGSFAWDGRASPLDASSRPTLPLAICWGSGDSRSDRRPRPGRLCVPIYSQSDCSGGDRSWRCALYEPRRFELESQWRKLPRKRSGRPERYNVKRVGKPPLQLRVAFPVTHPMLWTIGKLVNARMLRQFQRGGMAEWSMAVVLKTTAPETVPGVRIPLPPPDY